MLRLIFFIIVMIPEISSAQMINRGFICSKTSLLLHLDTGTPSSSYIMLNDERLALDEVEDDGDANLMKFVLVSKGKKVTEVILNIQGSGKVYIRDFQSNSWVPCVQ